MKIHEQHMETEESNKLIIVVVNRGFSETVMDCARDAGAGGGTIIHGRGSSANMQSVFGISADPEKDIVLIVAKKSLCIAIMEAVNGEVGCGTPAGGVCFALPVDNIVGGSFTNKEN